MIGGKTLGAIKAFFTDRHITDVADWPSQTLVREIARARVERDDDGNPWHRPVAPKRAYATEKQVADKVASVAPTQRAGLVQTVASWISGLFAVGGGALKLLPDQNEQAQPIIDVVKQFAPSVPTLAFGAVVMAVCIYTVIQTRKANRATQADYQQGKIN